MTNKDKERKFIGSIKRRSSLIDYRPHVNHRLFLQDDTFDLKYSAMLWCQSLCQELKKKCFDSFCERTVERLSSTIESIPLDPEEQDVLQTVYLRSTLSDPDSDYFLKRVVALLSSRTPNMVLSFIPPINIDSCHRLLVEIATDLFSQSSVQNALRKLPASVCSLFENEDLRWRSPVRLISELLSLVSSSSTPPIFCVVLPSAEHYNARVLADVAACFLEQRWRTLFLLAGSQLGTQLLFLDERFQNVVALSQIELCSPADLFSHFLLDLLPSNKLPVHFPASVIRSAHVEFFHSSQCLSSMIDRLMAHVDRHIRERKALLCMYSQTEWLSSMNLMKRSASRQTSNDEEESVCSGSTNKSDKRDVTSKALSSILQLLDKRDVEGTKLSLSFTSDQNKYSLDMETVRATIGEYNDGRSAARIFFQLLLALRDRLFTPVLKQRFNSVLLWAAVIDRTSVPTMNPVLHDFLSVLLVQTRDVSGKVISALAKDLHKLLTSTAVMKTSQQIETEALSEWVKNGVVGRAEKFQEVESLVDMLGEDDPLLLDMSFLQMEALKNSATGQNGTSIAVTVSPEALQQNNDSIAAAGSTIGNTSGRNFVVVLESFELFDNILQDFCLLIRSVMDEFARLSLGSEGLQGVLFIDQDSRQLHSAIDAVDLRKTFMSGLRHSFQLPSSTKNKKEKTKATVQNFLPDVCLLSDRVRFAQSMEPAFNWFEDFFPASSTHQWLIDKIRTGKKRSRADSEDETEESLNPLLLRELSKFRFLSSLNDLEKSGLIAVRRLERNETVIVKQMYAGILPDS